MLKLKQNPPVDYSLCNQTVTVYHQLGTGINHSCNRTVIHGASLDSKTVTSVDKSGLRESTSFLLVLPSGWSGRPTWVNADEYAVLDDKTGFFTLKAMDKVYLGEGPEIITREQWSAFVPAKVPGLVVIQNVDPKYWNGNVCHVEAGG